MNDAVLHSHAESIGVGAPADEIEVTPAMIEAGVAAMAGHHYRHAESDSWEDQVVSIYRAMRLASAFGDASKQL